MKKRRDVFQALADPSRRAIVCLLAVQPLTAGAIANNFEVARPTVSKHLKVLTECEVVVPDQHGREIYYQLDTAKLEEIDVWLAQLRKTWETRFDRLDQVLLNLKEKD